MKVQPSNRTAEEAVLGCCIENPILIDKCEGWIQDIEAFYYNKNKIIWKVMIDMWKKKEVIDSITLISRIKERYPSMEDIGYFITGLVQPTSVNVESYAKMVWEKHIQREVIRGAKELESMSYDNYEKVQEVLTKHKSKLIELEMMQPSMAQDVDSIVSETENSIRTRSNMIKFGIRALDDPAGGMTRKEISILGGRPGHGKTSLCLNIVRSLIHLDRKVILFNREMSNIEFMKKLITLESKYLDYGNVRKGELTPKEALELPTVIEKIKSKYNDKLIMYDTVRDVPSAMREIRKHSPDVVIDDYIQLIKANKNLDRRFQIEEILMEYKWIAKEKNIACLLVSQLSREIEKRLDPRPKMSDYAESGVIEQICENALFVFYGYNFDPENEEYGEYKSEIISAKARYGKPGRYPIGFNGGRCRFYATVEEALIDRAPTQMR